jgi:2-methylcitrate dehydratase PrpD
VISSPTGQVCAYAVEYRYELLPPAAVEAARVLVLDTLGAMLLGAGPEYGASRHTADLARENGGAAECTVIGRGFRSGLLGAALANGVLGYAADVEGGGVARQHAAAVLVPTVLTVGERQRADGRRLIAALALGYDVCARVAEAADTGTAYPHSFHPSAVFGHFGAAAAAGHLLGLDAARFENALGLAGINAGGLIAWVDDPTEDSRPYVTGMAAHGGVLAAHLAAGGMGGPLGILDGGKYNIYDAYSGAMRLEEITRDLGETFWITRHGGFKRYACCGDIHSGIDALLAILAEHDLPPEQIDEIVHKVHPDRRPVIDANPLKSHCAQYVMAVAAVERGIPRDTILRDYRESDPRVRELSQRVRLVGDAEAQALGQQSAVVEVRARDGRSYRSASRRWRGHVDDPMTPEELRAKFLELATSRIGREEAEQAVALIERLEELDDVGRLLGVVAGRVDNP